MARLQGKVAVITGAASGIGSACAQRFAAEGAAIAAIDLAKPSDEAWAKVAKHASATSFHELDVRDEPAVAAAVAAIARQHGRIDVLVNAAGVSGVGAAHELDEAEFDRVLGINLKGSFLVAKHVLGPMLAQQSGSIIHLASIEGLEGLPNQLAYNASKGGVVLMTKNMAIDYGRQGIRVNCLCPGAIDTPMLAALDQDLLRPIRQQMERYHALNRFGRPEEIANAALFLASDEASFVTGSAMVVDGGWMAGRPLDIPAPPS